MLMYIYINKYMYMYIRNTSPCFIVMVETFIVKTFPFQTGGNEGAFAIGQLLQERGVQLEYILDEGLTIINGIIPGVEKPAAL